MDITLTFDQSASSLPAGFVTAVKDAAEFYDTLFSNLISITIAVGYGEVDGNPVGSGYAESSYNLPGVFTYSQIRNALIATDTGSYDASAVASLPATSPVASNAQFIVSEAEAKALDLISGSPISPDGWVGFATNIDWDFNPSDRAVNGEYDFIGAAEHEISEVLGRFDDLNTESFGSDPTYTPLDLFRYSANGKRQLTSGAPSYFSVNSGATDLGDFNNYQTGNDGDLGDWASDVGNDAYNDDSFNNVENPVTPRDIQVMEALGYQLAGNPVIVPGQTFEIAAGESFSNLTVSSGGLLLVDSGGVASGTKILSDGSESIAARGLDRGATVSGGGDQAVFGSAANAVLRGGHQDDHGRTTSTTVSSGGREIVYSGGTASATVISSGGSAVVSSGGTASGAAVLSGGVESVTTSGIDRGATVSGGGDQAVFGSAANAVLRGGRQDDHGRTTSTTVSSGGREIVYSGGTASATVISSGGSATVSSGGVASGAVISGGKLEIASGGKAGTVGFSHSGTLQLDASQQFSGTVSGFALPDQIDLRDIGYTSGATHLTWTQHAGSGTLTVASGTHSATLTLDGTYTSGEFHLGSDGAGGTLVTDPPVTIVPAGGNETLVALSGPTIFDFAAEPLGHDTITGFDAAQDTIELNPQQAASFPALEADISNHNGKTLITLNAGHSITLAGIAPGPLTAANFRFV
jgi:autotransporter passenger strand-loop-strand repeat protein